MRISAINAEELEDVFRKNFKRNKEIYQELTGNSEQRKNEFLFKMFSRYLEQNISKNSTLHSTRNKIANQNYTKLDDDDVIKVDNIEITSLYYGEKIINKKFSYIKKELDGENGPSNSFLCYNYVVIFLKGMKKICMFQ